MTKSPQIKMYTTVSVTNTIPINQTALALLARAENEIELRVRTPFSTRESLEHYARDFATASDRTLIAVRQADWYKPFEDRLNPHEFFSEQYFDWFDKRERWKCENPRVKIIPAKIADEIAGKIVSADAKRLVTLEKILWVARGLGGSAEITLLPAAASDPDCRPITITIATEVCATDILRAIELFADRHRPVYTIVDQVIAAAAASRGPDAADQIWAHRARREGLYDAHWSRICAEKGYGDPNKAIRPCCCQSHYPPELRDIGAAALKMIEQIQHPIRHKPICYERCIDVLTYVSDTRLERSGKCVEVGKRESYIQGYKRLLAQAQRDGEA